MTLQCAMPFLFVKPNVVEHLKRGYPWVFRSDLVRTQPPEIEPGALVTLVDAHRQPFAIGFYNSQTSLVCRVLSFSPHDAINIDFFHGRFLRALERRQRFFQVPYYRLVHAESDHLPGLIIDRFDETLVCQTNTAGMERLKPLWLAALIDLIKPARVIFKDDTPSREKEGLALTITTPIGSPIDEIKIIENGLTYYSQYGGQKTGWFYDHRANRFWIASRTKKKTVLDLYAYQGGFGLLAAAKGAKQVTCVDRSAPALALAHHTANQHGFSQCEFIQEEIFTWLENAIQKKILFDIVIADPPAFVKQAQHQAAGLRGYQKLARLASQVVAPGGMLFIASCSHHAQPADFRKVVEMGIQKSERAFSLLRKAGADKDHPIHPLLPETQYLKSLAYRLD